METHAAWLSGTLGLSMQYILKIIGWFNIQGPDVYVGSYTPGMLTEPKCSE